ncbi:xanthine dehydrogenase [Amycolatopsis antarctica]|uniref:Xanthine dehydrogenase n=1 Tax=Amycolatopsis antarctica TaxID=1854586 RepID=A0A263D0I2_9PSEU|nr:xanthine dehydrogenase family protein molybdopterin-binding subunit [Amycolatopsis antarctica]OZM71638.1 xanthine dehydrogenase [Amycolatopsis antarctica]
MSETLDHAAVGQGLARRDGVKKVTGTAPYAYEHPVENPAFCHPVQATVSRGRITGFDDAAALALDGVLAVLNPGNAERLADTEDAELALLQDHEVAFRGQIIGAVVAESSEIARHGAELVAVTYDQAPHDVVLSDRRDDLYKPEVVNPAFPTDSDDGDVEKALAEAEYTIRQTYTTAMYHQNPLEPHTTTALSADGSLTLWDSTQGVHPVRRTVAAVLGMEPETVHVICPYLGGGFGSKGAPKAGTVLAAMAARAVPGRAVRLALTRQQMFDVAGYRTPTIQHVALAANRDGTLTGIAHDVVEQTAKIKEFAEQTAVSTRSMYAAPNRRTSHRLAALDVAVPSWMRAPGEAPGMFGTEVALDELAQQLGIDPIELRVINDPASDPDSGKPFSSRNLVACLREGAERFGWADRDPAPRSRQEGRWLVGSGVASSVYPVYRMPESTATVRFESGRYVAEIGSADLGTGTWTTLAQIAADALGTDIADVEVRIGDTRYPVASVAGGSSGMTTWGSAVVEAAREFRAKFGADPDDGDEIEASVQANPAAETYAMYAFGAQFVEARVNADTGEIRVPRMLGVFAAGKIVNPRLARSQFLGGMTMGLSMALHESSVMDPRFGHVVNHDLADYHITANADVGRMDITWLDEHDPHVNAVGSKGIGEIGIVGTAAAVSNAVHHATGVRVRELPITLDKVLR